MLRFLSPSWGRGNFLHFKKMARQTLQQGLPGGERPGKMVLFAVGQLGPVLWVGASPIPAGYTPASRRIKPISTFRLAALLFHLNILDGGNALRAFRQQAGHESGAGLGGLNLRRDRRPLGCRCWGTDCRTCSSRRHPWWFPPRFPRCGSAAASHRGGRARRSRTNRRRPDPARPDRPGCRAARRRCRRES